MEGLQRPPFTYGELAHVPKEIQVHVAPCRLVWIWLDHVGKVFFVGQLFISEQKLLSCRRLGNHLVVFVPVATTTAFTDINVEVSS